ncbi:two-component system response regulator [Paraburkholderia monticola]|uniref:Two-component system response regulator n=1 Tax=Paraburkholderia monticola TaxID=1399968 RepID=A0A149PBZ0_9BURK|nr:response regulator transcription factor [Paraburkholderia monticola]KXU82547.1 two-component system response regulator [Paraburkholderia monticola]
MKILSLEDDHAQSEVIRAVLAAEGHEVQTVREGSEAIRYLENATADLLVLDWQVSDISGLEVLGWVRERIGRKLPVLFLTNRTREDETITALNAGADDYMIKPVRRRELVARVNALLRRAYPPVHRHETLMTVGRYTIDFHARTVSFDDQVMGLTTKEFDVTAVLFRNLGRVMPRDMLVKMIWGRDLDKVSRSLDTHIYRLRNKLRLKPENGLRLRAIYMHGYRLERVTEESGF